MIRFSALFLAIIAILACGQAAQANILSFSFKLHSSMFNVGDTMPDSTAYRGFGCTGSNISPDLSWTGGPKNARSYELTVIDTTARPVWYHWLIWNIPGNVHSLAKGAGSPSGNKAPFGSMQGTNDYHQNGWGGPCPPPGEPHRYMFILAALDVPYVPGATPKTKGRALQGLIAKHLLGKALTIGTYQR